MKNSEGQESVGYARPHIGRSEERLSFEGLWGRVRYRHRFCRIESPLAARSAPARARFAATPMRKTSTNPIGRISSTKSSILRGAPISSKMKLSVVALRARQPSIALHHLPSAAESA